MSALATVLIPLILALMLAAPAALRELSYRLAPWAPLLLLWPWASAGEIALDWPLLGLGLALDEGSHPLALLCTVAWTLAGWLARDRIDRNRRWFWSGWLLALTGMHLLLLADNLATFYVGYAILSLSAYLLVTHARSEQAWRAGRIYLIMALAGEASILVGVLLLAGQLGNPGFDELQQAADVLLNSSARWFLLAGFAVKLGIIPLHVWLPLAHPVAPVPASAILSAVIVKAGLLGCLRMVPALATDPLWLGHALLVLGLLTTFGGALLGLAQSRIKTVLAYSTISQMGLIMSGFSLLFLVPGEREAVLGIIGLLALHHGLNKLALFMSCANQPGSSRWRLTLFALPALALCAVPMSTGFLAKTALKYELQSSPAAAAAVFLLTLSSTSTALLMWKAFTLARRMNSADRKAVHPAWVLAVLAAMVLPWWTAWQLGLDGILSTASLIDGLWPLLLAIVLVTAHARSLPTARINLPEGDLLAVVETLFKRWSSAPDAGLRFSLTRPSWRLPLGRWLRQLEQAQRRLPVAGLIMLLIGGLLWLLIGFA
ncbi:MAG: NADH dehydrogenase [Wenzhouxiangella sp.]|nr:NADH dehydrogenase [Wenzhouxiangella sp.]MCH8477992.1 complex I subunit 5 family protein [Wenzhouxiangella sp.]